MGMGPGILLAVLVALPGAPEVLDLGPDLGFDEAMLSSAIRTRRPGWPDTEHTVKLRALGGDAISIDVAGRHRVVPTSGLSGEARARTVALTVVDVLEGLSLAALTPEPPGPPVRLPEKVISVPPPVIAPDGLEPTLLGAVGGPALVGGVSAALSGSITEELRWLAEVGVWTGPSGRARGVAVSMIDVPIRLGLLLRLRDYGLELGLDGVAIPRFVSATPEPGRSELAATDRALFAFGVGARVAWATELAGPLALVLATGVDALMSASAVEVEGTTAVDTEHVRLWGGLGLRFKVRS